MNTPVVSIIIPSYQYGKYLSDAIHSIIKQTYTNWECIIIDDGSTDNTKEICEKYSNQDNRITYFYQKNSGLSAARNKGIANSIGTYIQFLDADDYLQPKKIEKQVLFLEQQPSINIVYSDVCYFFNNDKDKILKNRVGNLNESWMPYISGKGFLIQNEFIDRNIIELGCALFRKKDVEFLGDFNNSFFGVADWEYLCRAAFKDLAFQYNNAENGSLVMRSHLNSMGKINSLMQKHTLQARLFFNSYINNPILKERNKLYINNLFESIGYSLIVEKQWIIGRIYILKSGIMRKNVKVIFKAFLPKFLLNMLNAKYNIVI
ncbi:MAG: glycosyltransferase family 2 protein [Salinivirgaceae bacterium]